MVTIAPLTTRLGLEKQHADVEGSETKVPTDELLTSNWGQLARPDRIDMS